MFVTFLVGIGKHIWIHLTFWLYWLESLALDHQKACRKRLWETAVKTTSESNQNRQTRKQAVPFSWAHAWWFLLLSQKSQWICAVKEAIPFQKLDWNHYWGCLYPLPGAAVGLPLLLMYSYTGAGHINITCFPCCQRAQISSWTLILLRFWTKLVMWISIW